ncbi:hypothetical protein TIFTF001_007724 [Ficus carica]|uniref:Uncharacterized protein n=1 Tax=Ficus carica TaxID=3494 RepID=A0AA87ZTP8_FICCA|nr:hypothetical protein TIFTF001_007724 [Ficus carica]
MGGPRRGWGGCGPGAGKREKGEEKERGVGGPRRGGRQEAQGGGGWGEVRGGGPGVGGRRGGLPGAGEWGAGAGSPASGVSYRRPSSAAGRSPVTEKTLGEKGNIR